MENGAQADWTLLRSGGERIDRQSFFNFMKLWYEPKSSLANYGNETGPSRHLSKAEKQKIWSLYEQDSDKQIAKALGITQAQLVAIKYQPESLMYATEKSTEHLPGTTYDVNEHVKDYCLLANYVEHWSNSQKEIDYSKILNSMTFVGGSRLSLLTIIILSHLLLTDAIPRHKPHQTWEKLFR